MDGRELTGDVAEAAELLARVVGQDLEQTDGVFRIVRRTATDRVVSVADPDACHGHRTSTHGFGGYKGHVAMGPDGEIIVDTEATAGNVSDASVAADLIDDLSDPDVRGERDHGPDPESDSESETADDPEPAPDRRDGDESDGSAVCGDAAYGAGEFLHHLDDTDIDARRKTQPPTGRHGRFCKDAFDVDLDDDTVTCPNGIADPIRRNRHSDGQAAFGTACGDCRLRAQCTAAKDGRTIKVGRYERLLATARRRQQDPDWQADHRATRSKVVRKIGHLMRRRHGGRRAGMRYDPASGCATAV